MSGLVRVRTGRTASVRTQQPMFAIFLLAGGAMVRMTAPSAVIGYGMFEERCSARGRREGRLGGSSGSHGDAWWRAGEESQIDMLVGCVIDASTIKMDL